MSAQLYLYLAFILWGVQQVNDNVNAYRNRANVPGMFWVSTAASFLSGLAMFKFMFMTLDALVYVINAVFNH